MSKAQPSFDAELPDFLPEKEERKGPTGFHLKTLVSSSSDVRLLQAIHDRAETRTLCERLGKLWFLRRFVQANKLQTCVNTINEDEGTTYALATFVNDIFPKFQQTPYCLSRGAKLAVCDLYFPDATHIGENNPGLSHPSGFVVYVKIRPEDDHRTAQGIFVDSDYIRNLLAQRKAIKFAFLHYSPGVGRIDIYEVIYEEV